MDRRTFLKSVSAAIGGLTGLKYLKTAPKEPKPNEWLEYVEYADLKTDTLYIMVNDTVVDSYSPIPYIYFGPLKEKVESGEISFLATTKRVSQWSGLPSDSSQTVQTGSGAIFSENQYRCMVKRL